MAGQKHSGRMSGHLGSKTSPKSPRTQWPQSVPVAQWAESKTAGAEGGLKDHLYLTDEKLEPEAEELIPPSQATTARSQVPQV